MDSSTIITFIWCGTIITVCFMTLFCYLADKVIGNFAKYQTMQSAYQAFGNNSTAIGKYWSQGLKFIKSCLTIPNTPAVIDAVVRGINGDSILELPPTSKCPAVLPSPSIYPNCPFLQNQSMSKSKCPFLQNESMSKSKCPASRPVPIPPKMQSLISDMERTKATPCQRLPQKPMSACLPRLYAHPPPPKKKRFAKFSKNVRFEKPQFENLCADRCYQSKYCYVNRSIPQCMPQCAPNFCTVPNSKIENIPTPPFIRPSPQSLSMPKSMPKSYFQELIEIISPYRIFIEIISNAVCDVIKKKTAQPVPEPKAEDDWIDISNRVAHKTFQECPEILPTLQKFLASGNIDDDILLESLKKFYTTLIKNSTAEIMNLYFNDTPCAMLFTTPEKAEQTVCETPTPTTKTNNNNCELNNIITSLLPQVMNIFTRVNNCDNTITAPQCSPISSPISSPKSSPKCSPISSPISSPKSSSRGLRPPPPGRNMFRNNTCVSPITPPACATKPYVDGVSPESEGIRVFPKNVTDLISMDSDEDLFNSSFQKFDQAATNATASANTSSNNSETFSSDDE